MAKHQCSPNTIGAFLKGVGILRLHIDEQNNLIVTYTNGATQNVGPITPCDSELDDTSERPLMNKAIAGLYSHITEWIRALDADLDERVFNKVDKVPGKGLSSNDFTNANVVKLAGLRNYDDSEVREDISNISESILNIIDGGGRDVTIEGVRAIEKFLDGCSTSEPLINIRKDLLQRISEVALIIKDNSNDIALNRERITNSELAINGARREIVTLRENVLAASENVTDNNTRVEALGNRVAAAENDVATFDGRVDGIENTLLNHKERLNYVEARERENKENVSTLLAFQTKATQQITDAEADIKTAKENISINRFGIQANNNAIRTQRNTVASLQEIVNAIGENVEENTAEIGRKANSDGRYAKLTSGFSENIVGDGSATEEMFSLRPTAGEERNVANTTYIDGERNEAARITAIKGSSVVMNQMVYNADFAKNTEGWDVYGSEPSDSEMFVSNGVLITRINVEGAYWGPRSQPSISVNVGDKVLVMSKFNFATNKGNTKVLSTYCSTAASKAFSYSQNVWHEAWSVETMTESGKPRFAVRVTEASMGTIALAYLVAFNLTKMFGAGNEPTTAEEFYRRIPKGVDVRAYSEGEIIDGHYKALLSTAFNQFNGAYARVCAGVRYHITGDITSIGFTTEENGTTEDIALVDSKYTPSQNGYIYATGNNICIHICWAEYAHIEDMVEPYKPFERDLSWIKRYFPEGMRSAGSARDEIRYNAAEQRWEAVQRVGVVDLGSMEWEYASSGEMVAKLDSAKRPAKAVCSRYNYVADLGNANTDKTLILGANSYNLRILDSEYNSADSVTAFKNAMQGVMLNYELAEPIITPVTEEVSLDYDCSDYGSEELVSNGVSAPLVADIVYAPNALATLKQVPDILRRLAALEAKSVENINIEEL